MKFDTSPDQDTVKNPLLRPLWEDMVDAERLLEANDSQFGRRTFLRAAFAYIEGSLYWLKDIALNAYVQKAFQKESINISLASALVDDAPRVSRTGKITLEPNRLPFLNYAALVLRTLGDVTGADSASFFSDNGWQSLQKAITLRHQVTHPKKPSELQISDPQMQDVRTALAWLLRCVAAVAETQGFDATQLEGNPQQKN